MQTHLGRSVLAAQSEDEEDMTVGQKVLSDEPWCYSRHSGNQPRHNGYIT